MSIKLSAEDARWGIREAAWTVEERVLWRASDTSRAALQRALRAVSPLQRLIQTKLVWPLTDRLDDYGVVARTAIATVGVAAALGAGAAGVMVAGSGEVSPAPATAAAVVPQASDHGASLQGVPPDFVADPNASTTTAATQARAAAGRRRGVRDPARSGRMELRPSLRPVRGGKRGRRGGQDLQRIRHQASGHRAQRQPPAAAGGRQGPRGAGSERRPRQARPARR